MRRAVSVVNKNRMRTSGLVVHKDFVLSSVISYYPRACARTRVPKHECSLIYILRVIWLISSLAVHVLCTLR